MRLNARNVLRIFAATGTGIAIAGAVYFPTVAQQSNEAEIAARFQATLDAYCVACHNDDLLTANLSLEHVDPSDLSKDGEIWEKVLPKLRGQLMPPGGLPRPAHETYEELVAYLTGGLDRVARTNPNPGRPALHRLNRSEYANAIRDLLALDIDAEELLPADDTGYGFDNIGDVLTVSPLLLERYLTAADTIGRLAVGDMDLPVAVKSYEIPRGMVQRERMGEDLPFGSRGGLSIDHFFPVDGEYTLSVKLQRGRDGEILGADTERQVDLRLDGERLELFTVAADTSGRRRAIGSENEPDAHMVLRIPVGAGTHRLTASLTRDVGHIEGILGRVDGRGGEPQQAFFDGLGTLTVAGPYDATGPGETPSRQKIFTCYPNSDAAAAPCAREILTSLARRAYRRPVDEGDVANLIDLYQMGAAEDGFEGGVMLALTKILVSPEFIFRMEFDPEGAEPGSVYQVSDVELASRLSFFLWSSIPDDDLLRVAEAGDLSDPNILDAQVRRMLADPRADTLVTNFAGQWLFLRNIPRVLPDPASFPNFDENLRVALETETEMLVRSMLREDKSVVDLLDSDYTFVNERLAQHYGWEGIYGTEFRRVEITDERRRGLLGQGSILTVTSYPNRTAPTIRGKWVLEQLLGTTPPPPPPNVPTLVENAATQALTMRERMELHRTDAVCASCHRMMDPLGFALENFDGLGRWREVSGAEGYAIDASGEMPDGTAFSGPAGLRSVLMDRKDLFLDTFTERLLTYALGRGVEYYDHPAIRRITRDAEDDNYTWSSIIIGIVHSTPFQFRRVAEG
jgi:mono/diheme cytochrome c family protein